MNEKPKLKKDLLLELAQLRESENQWRTLAESSPDHILALAPDLTIQSANYPSPGLTIEELIGKPITSFLAEDRQVEIRAILQGVIDTGQAALYETEYPIPDGEVIYYETHAIPRKVDDRIEGLTLNSRDVTERKLSEKEIRHQQDLIESIFLAAPIGIGLVSNRIILQANDCLCDMVGYKRDELINQNARMLYPTQADFDFVGQEKYDQIDKSGTGSVETRFLRKDGEVIDVLLSSTPIDPDNLSEGVTFSALDITERKQAEKELQEKEEKFKGLFDTMSSGVVVYDVVDDGEDFIINNCNHAVETIERVKKEDIVGKSVTQAFPGVKDFGLFEVFQRVSRTGNPESFPLAVYKDEKDPGSWRDNWVYKLPSGEIVAIYNDITERMQAEKKLIDNENLLNATQKITKVGGWMWNVENKTMFWTDETYRIHEIDPNLIDAGSIKHVERSVNCYDEKDRPIIMNAFQKCEDEGIPYDLEIPFTTVKGNRKWIRTTAQAEKENGIIVRVIGNIMDITERVQAKQALMTANNIINRSPAAAFLWKNEEGWPVEFVSENVENLLGYSVYELTEGTLLYSDIIHSDDITRVNEEVDSAGRKKNQRIIEHEPYRIITKNGGFKWIADKTYIQRDSRGDITHYEGIIYDITNSILADMELRLRSEELAALLKTSRAVSSTLDLENILQTTTDSIVEIIGIDSAALYLLDGEELYLGATTPPLDSQMPDYLRRPDIADHPHLQKSIFNKLPVILDDARTADLTEEERAIRDNRGLKTIVYIPLMTRQQALGALILGTTGTPRSFSQKEIDLCITMANQVAVSLQNANLHEELKKYSIDLEEQILERNQYAKALMESEQNFRDLVGNLMDGVAIIDEKGFHIYINPRFSEITGYSEVELTKMTGWDFTMKEDLDQLKQKMEDRMAGKLVEKNYERIIVRKDGTELPVEMSTTMTVWQREKRPIAIIRDISERKQAEHDKDILLHQVQEANDRLRSLSRELINSQEAERKRISQELHDELGQALTAISLDLGIIELNLHPEAPPEIRDRLSDTKKKADGLDQMIRELALDLRPSLLDDLGLLPTLNWYVERFKQRSEIEVVVEVSGGEKRLPDEVETALYRIIQEALTNVVKHAKAKKVGLRIDKRAGAVMVIIEDDGRGFNIDSLQFPETSPRGLGLIGMADRTALVGGDFRIYSKPGEGARIEVEIPL